MWMEIPGVARDDLDVNLDGNLLTIGGKRELRKEKKAEDFLWEERIEGRFARTLRLPKTEPSMKSKIAIKSARRLGQLRFLTYFLTGSTTLIWQGS